MLILAEKCLLSTMRWSLWKGFSALIATYNQTEHELSPSQKPAAKHKRCFKAVFVLDANLMAVTYRQKQHNEWFGSWFKKGYSLFWPGKHAAGVGCGWSQCIHNHEAESGLEEGLINSQVLPEVTHFLQRGSNSHSPPKKCHQLGTKFTQVRTWEMFHIQTIAVPPLVMWHSKTQWEVLRYWPLAKQSEQLQSSYLVLLWMW